MKVAIISDTHDNMTAVDWIIKYLNENKISVAFHAGDIVNPGNIHNFNDHYVGDLHFVFGNNDGDGARIAAIAANSEKLNCYFEVMELEFENKKIFMNHYSTIAEQVAQNGNFDLVIGGHDHQYRTKQYGKTLFVNPGNTVNSANSEKGFVVLDLDTMEHERVLL